MGGLGRCYFLLLPAREVGATGALALLLLLLLLGLRPYAQLLFTVIWAGCSCGGEGRGRVGYRRRAGSEGRRTRRQLPLASVPPDAVVCWGSLACPHTHGYL